MTTTSLCTDQELVGAARDGDDRAFEELYARYRQRISRFAYRLTRDLDRADDITQDVFISALRRLRGSDRPIVFRPWIYEIARNACIDEHRRASRAREVSVPPDEQAGWRMAGTAPPPEAAIESKQALEDLRGAFRGLSDRHHKIIVLRELEGLSYRQIGDELGMSKMVVESTLFRARRRLTEEYQDLSSGRRCAHVQGLIAGAGGRPLRALGIRERRVLHQHIEHCRPCRLQARAAGWTPPRSRRLNGAAAALLPVPLLRLPTRLFARIHASVRGVHEAALPQAASSITYADTLVGAASGARAAAAAATLLIAVGGGLASTAVDHGHGAAHLAPSAGAGLLAPAGAGAAAGAPAVGARGSAASRGHARPRVSARPASGVRGVLVSGGGTATGGMPVRRAGGGTAAARIHSGGVARGGSGAVRSSTPGHAAPAGTAVGGTAGALHQTVAGATSGGTAGSTGTTLLQGDPNRPHPVRQAIHAAVGSTRQTVSTTAGSLTGGGGSEDPGGSTLSGVTATAGAQSTVSGTVNTATQAATTVTSGLGGLSSGSASQAG
jgi:RNA polymerase sigma factor (sigma-70 family)